ncbi:MAG: hypothetical protein HOP10_16020 [Chitinophagaceae bacterium]|nr:hypothetical protein [Chitinophagaceae bacterium]
MKPSSNYFVRTLACLLLCGASCISFAQETKKFDVSFVVFNTVSKKYLKQLDSVVLRNDLTGDEWIYDNMQTKDSIFKMEGIELSKYRIIPYQKGMIIPFVDFSACTFCRNKVNMIAYTSTTNKIFDRVFIGPHYDKGFDQLVKDFSAALTKDEIKTLNKTENKLKVKCFITADEKLSDIVFDQADLSEEIKRLIRKGFANTKAWKPAITNGKPYDDYISLSVAKIVD